MKHRAFAITLFGCLAASWPAAARPWRINQVPNGTVASCLTCHVIPGGQRNAFGLTVETYGSVGFLLNGDVQWGVAIAESPGAPPKTLAEIDSDGDGRTNGEELLDPVGVWRTGQPHPGDPALVRLPGDTRDSPVVIRQLYVRGGALGALFQNDFIELFNRSNQQVQIGGWSIQYASAMGSDTFGGSSSTLTVLPSNLILQPGQSYLVQEESGGVVGAPLAHPDYVGHIAFDDAAGKVVLVNDSEPLGCNGVPTTCQPMIARIVDLVGYGTLPNDIANYFEGLAAVKFPLPDGGVADGGEPLTNSAFTRARNGCTDLNSNGSNPTFPQVPPDFTLEPPAERSSTSVAACGPAAAPALGAFSLWILGLALAGLGALGVSLTPRPRARSAPAG